MQAGHAILLSDKECVERARNGTPEAFRFLVDRYQGPLFAHIASRLPDRLEAEEAAQESFVRAFTALTKLRQPDSFYAWLLGIASRVLQEQFRARKRRERQREIHEETLLTDPSAQPEDSPIEPAIAALPEAYRQVILLRYYEGLSCREIGEALEMPLGTVTKTLSRAYALLRQALKDGEGVEANVNPIQTNYELRRMPR